MFDNTIFAVVCILAVAMWVAGAALIVVASHALTISKYGNRAKLFAIDVMRNGRAALWAAQVILLGVFAIVQVDGSPLREQFANSTFWQLMTIVFVIVWLLLITVVCALVDMPGRHWLKRVDNTLGIVACVGLGIYSIVGARYFAWPHGVSEYALTGALALLFGFMLATRPIIRVTSVLARRIERHGSQPAIEASLRRAVRRLYPFIIAGAVLVVSSVYLALVGF